MFRISTRTSRRAWATLAVAAFFTSLAGVLALPATAEEPLAPAITNPVNVSQIHDVPAIDGTGTPGSTATVADGTGAIICSASVDEFGHFSCTGTQRLTVGEHELTVTTTSPDGTRTVGNTVLIQAVYYPNLSFPEPGSMISTQPGFSGQALPGVDVTLFDAAGVPVCTALSDEWGAYGCSPTEPLPLGPLTLTPSMTVSGGVVAGDSVNWTVIAAPVITSPANGSTVGDLPEFIGTGEPGVDIDILGGRSGLSFCSSVVRDDGTFSCVPKLRFLVGTADFFPAISKNRGNQVAGDMFTITVAVTPVIVSPRNDDVIAGAVEISGTAGFFTTVAILDDNGNTVCSAEPDREGTFSCVANPGLSVGKHTLTPVQTSKSDGSIITGAGIEVSVNADGVVPSAPGPTVSAVIETVTSAPTATSPPTAKSTATTQQLAATGATGTIWLAVVGGALLLLGGASLLTRFRRRTHG